MTGWLKPISQMDFDGYHVVSRLAKLGKTVESGVAQQGGTQAWTVMPARSGFYVLAYFSPDGDFVRYERLYDRMAASFVLLADGPSGASLSEGALAAESEREGSPAVFAAGCCFSPAHF